MEFWSDAALATLFAAMLALFTTIAGQRIRLILRQEKFKEIIYKEKLTIYQEVADKIFAIVFIFSLCEGVSEPAELRSKQLELPDQLSDLCITYTGGLYVIDNEVAQGCTEFCSQLSVVADQLSKPEPTNTLMMIALKITDDMRRDLHVDIISESTKKTLKQWRGFFH